MRTRFRLIRSCRLFLSTALAVVLLSSLPALQANAVGERLPRCWEQLPGAAMMDVEIGANGSMWGMGAYNEAAGAWPVYQWTGSAWAATGRYGLQVAVSPAGQPWYIDLQGGIFRLVNGVWEQVPGAATSIDIGAEGSVWVTGNVQLNGDGFGIYRWNGSGWDQIDGAAAMINVDRFGQPWVATFWPGSNIYRRFGNSWIMLPPNGATVDMGIGGGDAVWRTVYTPARGQDSLERWNGSGWTRVEGLGSRVTVDHTGRAWHVNGFGQVFYWTCA
ncbi:hypothetical protein [Kibdelosporangium aridum]|uniref:hypothetical protein n=1 Tax=Kibdelosporangium aridum TaxID=2030 RepID=UPI0005244227